MKPWGFHLLSYNWLKVFGFGKLLKRNSWLTFGRGNSDRTRFPNFWTKIKREHGLLASGKIQRICYTSIWENVLQETSRGCAGETFKKEMSAMSTMVQHSAVIFRPLLLCRWVALHILLVTSSRLCPLPLSNILAIRAIYIYLLYIIIVYLCY